MENATRSGLSGFIAFGVRWRWLSVGAPTLVVLFATFLVGQFAVRVEREQVQLTLEREAENTAHTLGESFDLYFETVQSVASLYAGSTEVERDEFRAFVSRNLVRYPGIQALEWVPRVAAAERDEFVAAARQEGLRDFQFSRWTPEGGWLSATEHWASEYFPVFFVEPHLGNEAALGIDLASNPARRAALEQSRDTGVPVATSPITLAQETGHQSGVLLFVPVYIGGEEGASVASRRAKLAGFALGVFRIGDIVHAVLADLDRDAVLLQITDDSARAQESRLLFQESASGVAGSEATALLAQHAVAYAFGGREWTFRFDATPAFQQRQRRAAPWLIGGGGLFAAVLVALVLLLITNRARTVERLVDARTAELVRAEARYRDLYDHAPDMYATVDVVSRRITDCNEALLRTTRLSREEILGRRVEEMYTDEFREEARRAFAEFERTGALAQQERRIVRSNAEPLDVTVSASAIRDAAGNITGSRTIWSDTSSIKTTERDLRTALGSIEELSERLREQATS
jgi:PAS domain S-box-containing protein